MNRKILKFLIFIALCQIQLLIAEENKNIEFDSALAQTDNVIEFDEFTVRAQKDPVRITVPTLTMKLTELDMQKINMVNPEDSLKYLPNLFVRKRFIGDTNGVFSMRGSGFFQNARSLVFADGMTLSNLLEDRWNGAPKWQIIAPEEIVSTEVMYGPYSAQYSGNAMNGVVHMHTRQPAEQEFTIGTNYFVQNFDKYGTDETIDGYKTFLSYGDKIGKLSYYFFQQHFEGEAQPQQFVSSTGLTPNSATGTPVVGAFADTDPQNQDRIVYGTIDFNDIDQDVYKLKTAFDFTDELRLQLTVGYWETRNEDLEVENYLRNAITGAPVWSGIVNVNGTSFDSGAGFRNPWAVNIQETEEMLVGATLEGALNEDWDFQTVFTWFDVLKDETRTSDLNPDDPAYTGSGRIKEFGDTYWATYDLKLGNDDLFNDDRVNFYTGYHFSKYNYEVEEQDSTNWRSKIRDKGLVNDDGGQTSMNALFAQIDWKVDDLWTLTLGGRQEWWEAEDGQDFQRIFEGGTLKTVLDNPPDRSESDFSPKISLAFDPDNEWLFRLSLAKAVRYPVVTEVFITESQDRNQVIGNSQLVPEEVFAKSLLIERSIDKGKWSLVFFHNDEEDTIFNQQVRLANGGIRGFFVNLEEVVTQGIEFSFNKEEFLHDRIDFGFNIAYNDATIEKAGVPLTDAEENPIDVDGNDLPRVPDFRINLFATLHATDKWDISAGVRLADEAFTELDNTDVNSGTYEGLSNLAVIDIKTTYTFDIGLALSFGIDNLTDDEYWAHHPFPQRTYHLDAKWKF